MIEVRSSRLAVFNVPALYVVSIILKMLLVRSVNDMIYVFVVAVLLHIQ